MIDDLSSGASINIHHYCFFSLYFKINGSPVPRSVTTEARWGWVRTRILSCPKLQGRCCCFVSGGDCWPSTASAWRVQEGGASSQRYSLGGQIAAVDVIGSWKEILTSEELKVWGQIPLSFSVYFPSKSELGSFHTSSPMGLNGCTSLWWIFHYIWFLFSIFWTAKVQTREHRSAKIKQETRVTPFTRSEKKRLISRPPAQRDASLTVCVFSSTAVINYPLLQSERRLWLCCHEHNHKLHVSPEFHTRQSCLFNESMTKINPDDGYSTVDFLTIPVCSHLLLWGEEPMKRLFPSQTDWWVFAFHPSEDAAPSNRQSESEKLLWLSSLSASRRDGFRCFQPPQFNSRRANSVWSGDRQWGKHLLALKAQGNLSNLASS